METKVLEPRKEFFEFMENFPDAMAIGEVIHYEETKIDLSTIRPECFMKVFVDAIYDSGFEDGETVIKDSLKQLLGIKEV